MSYSENLLYQMKYFPEIMKSYRFTADRAVKIEKECLEGEKTFVYILLTGEKTVAETVEELFLVRIPEQMQGCGFCTVEYSLQDEVFYSQEGLWVRTMHSFYDGICCHYLSVKVQEDVIRKSRVLFLYGNREPDLFDSLLIRKYMPVEHIGNLRRENLEALKEALADCPGYHTLHVEGKMQEEKEKPRVERWEPVLLPLVQLLYDHFDDPYSDMIRFCSEELRRRFMEQSRRILGSVLIVGDFAGNYITVERYLAYMKHVNQELAEYAEGKIASIIGNLREMQLLRSDLHNLLLANEDLNTVDDFMKEKVEGLYRAFSETR